jgi:uncharacterized membrane protein
MTWGQDASEAKTLQSNYGERPPRRHFAGWLFGGIAVFLLVAILLAILFHPYYAPGMMPYFGGWYFFPFGFFFFFFIIFGVGRLIFWPWGWGWRRNWYYHQHDEAADILRQRYARGEITKDQFTAMMKDLEQHG